MKKMLSVILCVLIVMSAMPFAVSAVDYGFTHLPTTREPYVEVNVKDGTKYQWYKFTPSISVVDYTNAYAVGDDSKCSVYESSAGWYPFITYEDHNAVFDYFVLDLKVGDILYIELSERPDPFSLQSFALIEYENASFAAYGEQLSDTEICFIVDESATYFLTCISQNLAPYVNANIIRNTTNKALSGKTSPTLSGVTDGIYTCKVTFADGTVLLSDFFEYCDHSFSKVDCLGQYCTKCKDYYGTPDPTNHVKWTNGTCVCGEKLAITHQPTADEKYVEVNYPDAATYQWYKYEHATTDVTKDNAYSPYNRYNAEHGWGACSDGNSQTRYIFFRINLKKGDVLFVEPTQTMNENSFWFLDSTEDVEGIVQDGKIVFEVTKDGTYYLKSDGESKSQRVKAYVEGGVPVIIEGQTSSELTLNGEGTYECKVTFPDSSSIISDRFELLHTHSFKTYVSNNDATCTQDGTKTATCSCGEKKTVADTGSALGHKDSNKDEKCDRCDYVYPHTHSFSSYVSNNDATCTQDGTKTATCSCGEEKTVADKGSALGHIDEDGDEKCDRCKTDLSQEVSCNHFCHSENSFIRIIYLIHRFFFRLLGVLQVCDCGALHY